MVCFGLTSVEQNATFGLVKSIVARRLVVDEVYDIIDRIQGTHAWTMPVGSLISWSCARVTDQMVRSVRQNAQKLCAQVGWRSRSGCVSYNDARPQVLLDFLLHYPMTDERLQQHLRHLLVNMAYEYEDGRLAVRALGVAGPLPYCESRCSICCMRSC